MKECTVCSTCFADNLDHCPTDRAPLKHSLRCDLILDERYRLERRLGRGGMGLVFKATHVFLRSTHAVKVILPHLVSEDAMLVTRFRQEAVVAASIRHKNIVSVTDFGVADDTMPFLVMDFLVGKSLWDIIQERGRLSAPASLEIMEAIGAGVSAAHRRGIVHRDLKPLNIFVQEGMPINEGLKILDFGLAKIKSSELYSSLIQAETTNLMGSPLYMAPEQWSEGEPDARADLYSMGIILYQMLAGDTPFNGSSMPKIMKGHLLSEPPAFASIGVRVSRDVEEVVRHALEKDPRNRPSSVEELLAELRQAVSKEDHVSDPLMITLQDEIETAPLPQLSSEVLTQKFGAASTAEPLSGDDKALIEAQRQIEDEAGRLMRELEDAQRRAEDARKRVEEAARKRAEKEAERKRAEEAAARKRAEEEQALKRVQEEEQKRAAIEEARKRAEEEEAKRLAAEQAQRELEQEQARKLAAEEANRLAMEVAEARSRAEEARKRAEEEAEGRAQEEAARREAEERAAKLAQELEAIQQRAEEARKRALEQELRRAEEDAERQSAQDESERKRAEEEERRRQDEEKARKLAEAEAARLAAEVKEAQQRVEEARIRAEEEAQRRSEEEAARRRAEEEALRLIHEVEEAKHRADEVRKLAEAEAIRLAREVDEVKQRENEVRKLAEEEARKEVARELERKFREQQERESANAAAHELGDEITIVRDRASSDTSPERLAQQVVRSDAGEIVIDSYHPRSFIKWIASVVVVVLLGIGGYAAYRLTRIPTPQPATPQPAEPPVIRPDLVSIPAGTFTMGRDDGRPNERPAHQVTVNAFFIDRTEVTNAEYAEFVRVTNYAPPGYWLGGKPPQQQEKLPVVDVSYNDAQAFAAWRSKRDGVNYRVPTEEEWEYAARGVNGYLYPWGKTWVDDYANVKSNSLKPVGSYPKGASSWGVLDMVGNVMEWTSSRASIYLGNKEVKIDVNKRDWIVLRGSSYTASDPLDMTTTTRQQLPASNKHPFVGFRLVRNGSL